MCWSVHHEVKMAKAAGLEVVAAGWGHSVEPIQDSDCDYGNMWFTWEHGKMYYNIIDIIYNNYNNNYNNYTNI